MRRWILNVLIALDQFLGALLLGTDPDMTISAQAWLWEMQGKRSWPRKLIDCLFFLEPNHCRESFRSEYEKKHFPEELK